MLTLIIIAVIPTSISNLLRRFRARPVAALAAVLLGHAAAFAGPHGEQRTLPDFDKRPPADAAAVAPDKAAAATQLRARLRGARVEMDAVSDAPEFVGSPHEFLTGLFVYHLSH